MTEVHIGEIASRIEASAPAAGDDDALVARIAAAVARRIESERELAAARRIGEPNLFADAERGD